MRLADNCHWGCSMSKSLPFGKRELASRLAGGGNLYFAVVHAREGVAGPVGGGVDQFGLGTTTKAAGSPCNVILIVIFSATSLSAS